MNLSTPHNGHSSSCKWSPDGPYTAQNSLSPEESTEQRPMPTWDRASNHRVSHFPQRSINLCLCWNAMAPYSSTLAWEIPWMEEPGRLQSMGLLRIRHDWATSLSLFTFMDWRRKWQTTPVFLPGESQGWEPGGLPSMGSHRVGHDWSDLASLASNENFLKSIFFYSLIF